MTSKESIESWKKDLTHRAEEVAGQKRPLSEDPVAKLQKIENDERQQNEILARAAADLKLVAADPVARGLYDLMNEAKASMGDVMKKIDKLIPETNDLEALVVEQMNIAREASRGEYREGEMGELQKQLQEARNLENKNWKAWANYAAKHRAEFMGKIESGEKDLYEAGSAEDIRQKKRRETSS